MTEGNGQAPVPAERGRYAVYPQDPSGLIIARRVNLCQRCLNCGCGDPADDIDLTPNGAMKLIGSKRLQAMARVMIPGMAKQ